MLTLTSLSHGSCNSRFANVARIRIRLTIGLAAKAVREHHFKINKFQIDNCIVKYDNSQKAKDRAFEMLLDFYKTQGVFSTESMCQNDQPQVDAPEVLGNIVEKAFKFNVTYK